MKQRTFDVALVDKRRHFNPVPVPAVKSVAQKSKAYNLFIEKFVKMAASLIN
jgi:hypothetical protein